VRRASPKATAASPKSPCELRAWTGAATIKVVGSAANSKLFATRSRTTSLHPPLLLSRLGRRLVLERLPLPRRLIVLPVNQMRINLRVERIDPCTSRADTAGNGTPLASRCEQCKCLREGRLAPLGSFSRRNRSETAAEMESSLKGDPSGLANIKVQVGPILLGAKLQTSLYELEMIGERVPWIRFSRHSRIFSLCLPDEGNLLTSAMRRRLSRSPRVCCPHSSLRRGR
jgi:hypothetical protein